MKEERRIGQVIVAAGKYEQEFGPVSAEVIPSENLKKI
jgi:hypothetical protein